MKNPTFEKLDRVLASTEWEQHFPRALVVALTREISDHTPLLLSSEEDRVVKNNLYSSLNWLGYLKRASLS